jgi:DNA-binding MarR family transcriptional regulator
MRLETRLNPLSGERPPAFGSMTQLNNDEMALWQAWKQAADTVRTLVAADITAETGLSDPDFGVLTRVVEIGHGRMRQSRLGVLMGFQRSRLSHHLTRMEARGLIKREPVSMGVDVVVTAAGEMQWSEPVLFTPLPFADTFSPISHEVSPQSSSKSCGDWEHLPCSRPWLGGRSPIALKA